jgi:hypothetical protein
MKTPPKAACYHAQKMRLIVFWTARILRAQVHEARKMRAVRKRS